MSNATLNGHTTNGKAPSNDLAEINRTLDLFRGNGVFELRHLAPGWKGRKETNSGYFDDLDKLAGLAASAKSGNVYFTLNPVDKDLLSRRCNRVDVVGDDDTTKDKHVTSRKQLLVDFDVQRPTGMSSSEEEHAEAIDLAKRAGRALMKHCGFPEPVIADSGNGAHLIYRIDLPNDAESTALVQRVLAEMQDRFGTDSISIDQTVSNAARITKFYGTVVRKGDHTHDRPHRLSRLLHVPDAIEVVTREQLEAFAGPPAAPKPKPKQQSAGEQFDVESFIARNLSVKSQGDYSNQNGAAYRWKLETCPLCGESDKSAVVLLFDDGRLGYKCHHNRCYGLSWRDLREHFEPGYQDRQHEYREKIDVDSFGEIPAPAEKTGKQPTYQRITCKELASGDYALEYLIDGTMAAGQPLIIAGPQKVLKTSIIIDSAISLALGGYFLGRLNVPAATRVAVMSGESGLATIQETAFRISAAAGHHLADIDNLIWSSDIPKFGDGHHLLAMEKFLKDDEIAVLFIDPAYLAMPSQDSGNLMAQGELLRGMASLCSSMGVTMVLAHHTKKNTLTPSNEPPELSDISWAGFAEFARQWWLLGRREKYEPGSGEHKLWLSVGGSAGHSALWGLDISEGVYSEHTPRQWAVEVRHGHEVFTEQTDAKDDRRRQRAEEKAAEQAEADLAKVVAAMTRLKRPETKSNIKDASRLSVARANSALLQLEGDNVVRKVTVERTNGQKYEGYELCPE